MPTPASPTIAAHEARVVEYYDQDTALYVNSWDSQHFHFGIFEPGELRPEHRHPDQVPALRKALLRMIERIVAPADLEEGRQVVDAGCGVGGTAQWLAGRFGVQVRGVNICRRQLRIAERRAARGPLGDRVSFHWGDCSQRLPFDDASVDAIVNVESACHYSDRARFIAECHRILRPGGTLAAMDWVVPDEVDEHRAAAVIDPVCEAWTMVSLERPSGYRALLEDAGLRLLEEEMLGEEVRPNALLFARGARMLEEQGAHLELDMSTQRLYLQFDRLSRAWLAGDFGLYRYAARK